jgi:hypothetical protein
MWVVHTLQPERVLDISGRYGADERDDKNPYTLCRRSPPRICLTPAQAVGGRKPNLAPVILEMSLDTSPFRRRTPDKDK